MNIKITIKDADSGPVLIHKNQLSEAQYRKKNTLYQKPQRDRPAQKKTTSVNNTIKDDKGLRRTGLRSSGEDDQSYRKAEQKMMEDLDKMSKNQASLDMIHNSNNILKKQAEILEENQKTLYQMAKNKGSQPQNQSDARECDNILGQIRKEVDQMRKIKEEIERSSKQFTRALNDTSQGALRQPTIQSVPQNVTEMNANLKNLAEISKNQLQGLENMEAIKNLQNFNMEGYTQAINGLKRQIVQYQKESEQIERQLKLRAAKLQKLEIKPNFDDQLIAPYENYLKKRADAIDLYAIREKVYEKLGVFDYGKFQNDINQIMAEVKGQMNEFQIICKDYRIQVPDIKIDQKQLKGLDLKLPSAIDQFKAERGINFSKPTESRDQDTERLGDSRNRRNRKKGEPIVSFKGAQKASKSQKIPQAVRELNTKPMDLTTQVKLQKMNQPTQKTVLENDRQKNKKLVEGNIKKMRKGKEDEDFQKYLQYRARQELQLLYKEKKERLQKQQDQLFELCKEQPQIYLNLDLKNEVRRNTSRQKKEEDKMQIKRLSQEKRPQINEKQQEEQEEEQVPKLRPIPGSGGQTIKEVGTEVLKEKLKNLLGGNNGPRRPPENYQQNLQQQMNLQPHPSVQIQNVAENFLSMINNTLTQVNNNISKTIQAKYEQRSISKQKYESYRRSPPKIAIPKLQQIKPPPAFNMPVYNPSERHIYHAPYVVPVPAPIQKAPIQRPKIQQKIEQRNYDHLKIKVDEEEEELEISQDDYSQDFD